MKRLRKHDLMIASAIALLSSTGSQAATNFTFDYSDASNMSFWTQPRMDSLDRAAAVVSSYFSNYTANVQLMVTSQNDMSTTLASAGSSGTGVFTPGFGSSDVVMNKILTGIDDNAAAADGTVTVNWGQAWNLSANPADVPNNQYDFESTMIHELFHAVGFSSSITAAGKDGYNTPTGMAGDWSPFDRYVGDSSGLLINQTTFVMSETGYAASAVGGAGALGLSFQGPNTMAANGGMPLFIYTPNPYEEGSSGSHTDDQQPGYNFIMNAATNFGPGVRTLSAQEIGLLQDIGYLNIVPEPSSALLSGLAAVALLARRRRI